MKILLTAIGFQGGYNLVRAFQEKGFEVIGVDMNKDCAAKFYCDKFYPISPGASKGYIKTLERIIKKERPNVLLPGSSTDIVPLTANKKRLEKLGVKIMISKTKPAVIALDKRATYEILERIVPLPKYIYAEQYILKPTIGKGAKGIEEINKPNCLIMEKLEGEHIDIDVLSWKGQLLLAECKTRERAYGGTLMEGEIVRRPEIITQIKKILKVIPLDYLSVWQFTSGKLLEINPRIAGAIIDFNVPLSLALARISSWSI